VEPLEGDTNATPARKRRSEQDDMHLLVQVNNDLPFKATKNTIKAWDLLAAKPLDIEAFTRKDIH